MIYAVIDTNVLVAAVKTTKPDSSTSQVLSLVFTGVIKPLVSEEILSEYNDILKLPVLDLNPEKVADVLEKFREDGLYPGRTQSNEIFPDETDRIFYEISLSVEDSHVVTNNVKHFPKVSRVVTPSEMLALLRSTGEI